MMSNERVEVAKKLWEYWDIRVLILLSLLIQVLLTFLAPLRKRVASGILGLSLWLLYLLASVVALYIISQISGNLGGLSEQMDILAMWSPFLLLHLGGPDTITALALEDNELWHRHALELVTQLGVTLVVFRKSVISQQSHLWIPTSLMFVDGCIKYFERTQALYHASIDSFRDSLETEPEPGPNYARLMDVYRSSAVANIPTAIQGRDDPSISKGGRNNTMASRRGDSSDATVIDDNDFRREDTDELILEAHHFYNKFKAIIADNFLSLKDRKESRDVFMVKLPAQAWRIIEIELNLMYDVFYTKVFLLESKQALLRIISFLAVTASLVVFALTDKTRYPGIDVLITYILLGGAIALDMSAAIMVVLSDWYIAIHDRRSKLNRWRRHVSGALINLFKSARRPLRDRWSRFISEYSLLKCCFKDPPHVFKLIPIRRIIDMLTAWLYVASDQDEEIIIARFIVTELQKRAEDVQEDDLQIVKEVCSARGNLILQDDYKFISDYLQPWTTDIDYDESLLTWHLATDICYHTLSSTVDHKSEYIAIGKNLSDYMAYLLLMQQTLVSAVVGMVDKRFTDTCAEARKFNMNRKLDPWYVDVWFKVVTLVHHLTKGRLLWDAKDEMKTREKRFLKEVCERLLQVSVDIRPIVAKGDKSKSVLFEACRLAKQLKMLGKEKQWEIISKVWLEMLCYAAVRCTARSHVSKLSRGGQLITIVWLLMAHLGFGERFLQNQGFGWTKLLIQK